MRKHPGDRQRIAWLLMIVLASLAANAQKRDPSKQGGFPSQVSKSESAGLLAPSPPPAFAGTTHTSWTRRDGAPGSITSLAQTTDGYLWVGSSLGLYRFDGLRFIAYPFSSNEHALPSLDVASIASDPAGGLWVAMRSTAVVNIRLDGSTTFYDRNSGLATNTLDHIFALPDGSVWAAGGSQLFQLRDHHWVSLRERGLLNNGVFSVLFDRESNIWVGQDKKLALLRRGAPRFQYLSDPVHYVSSMTQTRTGEIWLADAWRSVHSLSDKSPAGAFHIQGKAHLLVDRDDTLWIAQDDEGLARIRNVSVPGPKATTEVAGPGDLSARETNALLEDREGNIWVGTERGLDRFKKTPFVPFRATELRFFPSLLAADDGSVWINSHGSSLMHVRDGETTPVGPHVNSGPLVKRRNGDVCFADQTSYQLQCYGASAQSKPLPAALEHVPPKSLVEDVDGALLLSTQGKGIWRYADGEWSAFHPPGASLGSPWSLYSDSSGKLWMGYGDNKVILREGDSYKTLTIGNEPRSNTLVFAEGAGTLWAAGSNGLCFFDGEGFRRVSTLERNLLLGTPGIAFDHSGTMWPNSAAGVLRVTPDELQHIRNDPSHLARAEVFDENDGLVGQPTQYKRAPSAIVDGSGILWFATAGNVVSLDPNRLGVRSTLPSVLIEEILVDGKPAARAGGTLLRIPANELHDLAISYIGIDLSAPERVNYRYWLVGEDKAWQDAGTRRQAFYTRLSPGTYWFHVSASNGGEWSDLVLPLRLEITPAFYQTWWFRLLCVALLIVCTWLILRARTRFLTEQLHARLSERLAERERVARELHDGLLQGFQGLMMRFHLAAQAIPHQEEARTEMEQALDRADELLIQSRDRIKDLRSERLVPATLIDALSDLRSELDLKGAISFSITQKGTARELVPTANQEVYAVAREAIINAYKHSNAPMIGVSISFEPAMLTVCVRDDGCGISHSIKESNGKSDHWGIAGMQERARDLHAKLTMTTPAEGGTLWCLAVPGAIAYRTSRDSRWRAIFRRR